MVCHRADSRRRRAHPRFSLLRSRPISMDRRLCLPLRLRHRRTPPRQFPLPGAGTVPGTPLGETRASQSMGTGPGGTGSQSLVFPQLQGVRAHGRSCRGLFWSAPGGAPYAGPALYLWGSGGSGRLSGEKPGRLLCPRYPGADPVPLFKGPRRPGDPGATPRNRNFGHRRRLCAHAADAAFGSRFLLQLHSVDPPPVWAGAPTLPKSVPWPWTLGLPSGLEIKELHRFCSSFLFVFFPAVYLIAVVETLGTRVGALCSRSLLIAATVVGLPFLHHVFIRPDLGHLGQASHPFLLALLALSPRFGLGNQKRVLPALFAFLLMISVLVVPWQIYPTAAKIGAAVSAEPSLQRYRIGHDQIWLSPEGIVTLIVLGRKGSHWIPFQAAALALSHTLNASFRNRLNVSLLHK